MCTTVLKIFEIQETNHKVGFSLDLFRGLWPILLLDSLERIGEAATALVWPAKLFELLDKRPILCWN